MVGLISWMMACGPASRSSNPTTALQAPPETHSTSEPQVAARSALLANPVIEIVRTDFISAVHGMTLDVSGNLYFSDTFGQHQPERRIYRLAPPYQADPEAIPIAVAMPAGLAWHKDKLFVCDTKAGHVTSYDANYAVAERWEVPAPWNVSFDSEGSMLAASNDGNVYKLGTDLGVSTIATGADAPFAIVATDAGYWLSEQGKGPGLVSHRNNDGSPATIAKFAWANPEGLAVGTDGKLWVAETETGQLIRVSHNGQVEVMKPGLTLPIALAASDDGEIFAATGGKEPALLRIRFVEQP